MKDIKGFEKRYAVTKDGRIWSYPKHYKRGQFLRQNSIGRYKKVELWDGERGKQFDTHRLVALTYIPNPLGLPMVNHKDGKKWNNRVGNLEWCNAEANMEHAKTHGLILRGSKNPAHKLTEGQVRTIRTRAHETLGMLANEYGVTKQLIWQIRKRRAWSHVE